MSEPLHPSEPLAGRSSALARNGSGPGDRGTPSNTWTFLSNHAHVLFCIARDGTARVRDIALAVGLTERAVQRILRELEVEGVLERERHGRRNRYRIHPESPLRHPLEADRTVGDLLRLLRSAE